MKEFLGIDDKNLIFRFRNTDALLNRFHELENQEIYFCPYSELNDPAEGNINVFWQGDRILWENLFKHYFICVFLSWSRICLGITDNFKEIPIWTDWKKYNINNLLNELFNTHEMQFIFEMIGDYEDQIEENELQIYLFMITGRSIDIISRNLMNNPLTNLERKPFRQYNGLDNLHIHDSITRKRAFESLNEVLNIQKEKALESLQGKELERFMFIDYPQYYIRSVLELMFPKWYVSSFCNTYTNSRMWANYADNHKGACLIFKVSNENSEKTIRLNTCHEWSIKGKYIYQFHPEQLHDITYSNDYKAVNFFQMLGNVQRGMLKTFFLNDEGKKSSYWVYDDYNDWQIKYWKHMKDIACTKTEDWKEEGESRVILENDFIMNYDQTDKRKIKYKFQDFVGIILGLRISDIDKEQIKAILQKKCINYCISEFPIYQEKIDKETGNIKVVRIATLPAC